MLLKVRLHLITLLFLICILSYANSDLLQQFDQERECIQNNIDSTLFYIHFDYQSSERFVEEALKLSQAINDTFYISKSLMMKGRILHLNGRSKEGRKLLLKALDLAKTTNNKLLLAEIYDNLGLNLRNHGMYDEAIDYYKQATKLRVEEKDTLGLVNVLMNYSAIQRDKACEFRIINKDESEKLMDEGMAYLDSALVLLKYKPNTKLESEVCYLKAILHDNKGAYSKGLDLLRPSMIYERNHYGYVSPKMHLFVSNFYVKLGNRRLAEVYLDSALLNISKYIPIRNREILYSRLASSYAGVGNYKKAYESSLEFHDIIGSILINESKDKTSVSLVEERRKEIALQLNRLKYENEIKEITISNNRNIILIIALMLVITTILAVIIYNSRQKLSIKTKIIESQNQEILKASDLKDRLYAIISHDIKNPLIGIQTISNTIKGAATSDIETVKRLNSDVLLNAEGLIKLLDNMLEWTKMQTGELKIFPQKINLHELIFKIREINVNHLNHKNLKLVNSIDPDIVITADYQMMYTVFQNLISNAIKYSYPDSDIICESITADSKIHIVIKDFGVGLDKSEVEKILDPQSEYIKAGTENEKGSGIGFKVVKGFLSLHNGTVSVNSKKGEHTAFRVSLPNI